MKNVTKLLALLLTLALLVSVPTVAFAAETVADLFPATEDILNSITVEETTGKGLAFLFEMKVSGADVNGKDEYVSGSAVATVDGVDYAVVSMGAVMTNQPAYIAAIDSLTREDVNEERTILDVVAKTMFYVEEETCAFAVRIIHLPETVKGFAIATRPYVVLQNGDEEITLYGNTDTATYNQVYYKNNPEETPVLTLAPVDLGDKIVVSDAASAYEAICPTTYKEGFRVSLTLENVSTNAATSAGDYVVCAYKDADGNLLGTETVAVDVLTPGDTKDVVLYAPIGTAIIEAAEIDLNYVPVITLPEIGSDIDVTKKKNRIRVSAASASFNEDGTIHVSLTFKNYTSNWITEETDYVQYTYYNAVGTKIKTETLYIGVIDTKKHPTKTFEFDVPANAASVKITKSKIVYWTEWS